MTHIQYIDELIREYLLFRGFAGTLKMFDIELKQDKEKGFRVDRIVDQFLQLIYAHDLSAVREFWNHLYTRMFSKLEIEFTSCKFVSLYLYHEFFFFTTLLHGANSDYLFLSHSHGK
ncbi:hypothetical protein WDU94_000811 [Cyamophila willieti]